MKYWFWGSKNLLEVSKTSQHSCDTIYEHLEVIWKNHENSLFFWYFPLELKSPTDQNKVFWSHFTTFECNYTVKKRKDCLKNARNVFRNIKVPLWDDVRHWNYLFWSLWRILVILTLKMAIKGVFSLMNHTPFPCKLYYFSKFYQKHVNGHFLNLKSLIRLSQVIPIDVLWLDYPYWPIVSILRIQILEILMIFCHSPADTATNKKIIWSGVY